MAFKPSFDETKKSFKIHGRLSYWKGDVKSASVEGGPLKYRTNLLMNKNDPLGKASIKVVEKALKACIEGAWPGKDWQKFYNHLGDHSGANGDRSGLHDGDKRTNEDGEVRAGYEDCMFLKLSSDKRPKYLNRRGEQLDADEIDDLLRSGYQVIIYGNFYPIKDKAKGGNGIFAGLNAIQFFKRDEEFSGGFDPEEADDLGEDEDDGMDDEDEAPKPKSKKRPADEDDDDL